MLPLAADIYKTKREWPGGGEGGCDSQVAPRTKREWLRKCMKFRKKWCPKVQYLTLIQLK